MKIYGLMFLCIFVASVSYAAPTPQAQTVRSANKYPPIPRLIAEQEKHAQLILPRHSQYPTQALFKFDGEICVTCPWCEEELVLELPHKHDSDSITTCCLTFDTDRCVATIFLTIGKSNEDSIVTLSITSNDSDVILEGAATALDGSDSGIIYVRGPDDIEPFEFNHLYKPEPQAKTTVLEKVTVKPCSGKLKKPKKITQAHALKYGDRIEEELLKKAEIFSVYLFGKLADWRDFDYKTENVKTRLNTKEIQEAINKSCHASERNVESSYFWEQAWIYGIGDYLVPYILINEKGRPFYLVTTAGVFKQGIYQLSEEDVPTIEPAIRHFRQLIMSKIAGLLSKTLESTSGRYTPIIVL